MKGISYMEMIREHPYKDRKSLAEEFNISVATVRNRQKGIEGEIKAGRYDDYTVLDDGKNIWINLYAFIDYLKYRRALENKTTRKCVPPFRPDNIRKLCGYGEKAVMEDD